MTVSYVTREQLVGSLDVPELARRGEQVMRDLLSASRTVEGELQRIFYPQVDVREFARVGFNHRSGRPMLFLQEHELVELDSLTVDGIVVDEANLLLRPQNGPPFNRVEFRNGVRSGLRDVEAAGTFGYRTDEQPAGQLVDAIDDATTTVDTTAVPAIGTGSLLRVDTERMLVAARTMLDTGQTLQDSLAASVADTSVVVVDGPTFAIGDVLRVDTERMLVRDIAGNTLVVRRGFDGTAPATHATGAGVDALRRLTVERGVLGTGASAHDAAASVRLQLYPPQVIAYTLALTQSVLLQEIAGQTQQTEGEFGRTVVEMARERAKTELGRPFLVS